MNKKLVVYFSHKGKDFNNKKNYHSVYMKEVV